MAADFFFANPTFEIPSLAATAVFKWQHLHDRDIQHAIAADEQYLAFHLFVLNQLRHTAAGAIDQKPYAMHLGLSVRAGAVKAAVLVAGSILEAALRVLAERRGYPLNRDPRKRTFGNVLRSWQENDQPRQDLLLVWPEISAIHQARNFVHLHNAAQANDAVWEEVLRQEDALLQGALRAINHVAQLEA